MRKILLSLIFISLVSVNAQAATTWYVRVAGGTSTQCTGTTNADYSGSGSGQLCAFSSPVWVIGATGTTAKWVGGDTMIVDDNGGTAQYLIGYGMANTLGCSSASPYSCVLNTLPSGTPTANTKIYGSAYATGCATKPQLWGTQSVNQVLNVSGVSNLDMECIEITDHSNCGFRIGNPQCSEAYPNSATYGRQGVMGTGSTNLLFKNVDVHGMSDRNFLLGDLSGVNTFDHVNTDGGYGANWDGDERYKGGTGSLNNGTLNLIYYKNRFAGCREAYPRSGSFTVADYDMCNDQNSGGGYGDGLGTYISGGTWNIYNSEFSHNTQDGLDLLYCQNCQSLNIDKTLFEGNDGNQLKFTTKNLNLTNSVIIANCDYHTRTGKVYNTSTWSDCRANGTPISATAGAGGTWKITNNTSYTSTGPGGSPFIEILDRYGLCNGTESYTYKNNVLVSNHSATNWTPYYNGLSGACSTPFAAATTDHSVVYNFSTNPAGTGNVFTSALFVSSISLTAASNLSSVFLQAGSPAVGAGLATAVWNTKPDINNFPQNSPVDAGGIQRSSVVTLAQAGQTCTATSDCAAGTCTNFACTGSCTAHGGACAGNTCCGTDVCSASVCSTPSTCGDAVIQSNETCDTTNMNGSNCTLQGFTGGSLACAANCLSYDTSSCTSTTLFPLTPILDTFTRSNSTGISNTSWTLMQGSFNISSNAAIPVTGGSFNNLYYWNAATFAADEEARVTISNKGSNGDDVALYVRMNPNAYLGYKLEVNPASSHWTFYKQVPAETLLCGPITQAVTTGDSVGISIVGTTMKAWYKSGAGSWTSIGTCTDSTYTAGGSIILSSSTGASTPDIKFTNFGGGQINPIACGNSLKEGNESCDGTDLASQTCITQGFASGTLSCASNCNSFVTSSCTSASVCGNNTRETGEVCDGIDLNSQTCAGLGFASGTISCATDCKSYVTTSCVTSGSSGTRGGITMK